MTGSTDAEPVDLRQIDTVEDELDEFCRAIRGEASPETDGQVARSIVAVLEAIVASDGQRSFVDVN